MVVVGNENTYDICSMELKHLEERACSVLTYCYWLSLFGKNEQANPVLKTYFFSFI